jgi:hypothetical protein
VIVYGSNPGNLSHLYFKSGFVDQAPDGTVFQAPTEDEGLRRCFLRARLDDNPSLDVGYRRMLEGIADEVLRRALLEGDWDVFAGQFFRAWRRDKHVIQPFKIPDDWLNRRVAVDFGFGAPWAAYFFVRDEYLWRTERIHRWFAYRELYERGVRDEDQARRIAAAIREDLDEYPLAHFEVVGDPSMWNRQPNGVSIATVYAKYGVPMSPANNDRVPGWQRLREYLADQDDDYPALVFFETCFNAIRTLPAQVHDEHRVEDLDTDGEDHAADAARYFVMSAGPLEMYKQDPQPRSSYGWGLR